MSPCPLGPRTSNSRSRQWTRAAALPGHTQRLLQTGLGGRRMRRGVVQQEECAVRAIEFGLPEPSTSGDRRQRCSDVPETLGHVASG